MVENICQRSHSVAAQHQQRPNWWGKNICGELRQGRQEWEKRGKREAGGQVTDGWNWMQSLASFHFNMHCTTPIARCNALQCNVFAQTIANANAMRFYAFAHSVCDTLNHHCSSLLSIAIASRIALQINWISALKAS